MMPPDAILELKGHQNAFVAGEAPDPTGEAYSAPQTP